MTPAILTTDGGEAARLRARITEHFARAGHNVAGNAPLVVSDWFPPGAEERQ